jgi:tRNA modification GTPase
MPADSTIFAPATAAGKAGVAVLRISGPNAGAALAAIGVSPLPQPRVATLVKLRAAPDGGSTPRSGSASDSASPSGDIIDNALALWFPAPASFTGEDVAELHVHGSRAVMKAILGVLSDLPGLRMAEPGEFSRRAYLNGKMDLTEVEGLADLIDAETEAQRAQALNALEGAQGARFKQLRETVVHALAHLEAYIDFPDEEIPPDVLSGIHADVRGLMANIESLLADNHRGERIRDGIRVVILGAPNAGKSTLLNALAQRDAAIVSATPGTTRDAIEVHLDIAGYAVTLIDTAGLRASSDDIEQEGIRRARAHAENADLRLVLFDGSQLPELDAESGALLTANSIALLTKSECLMTPAPDQIGTRPALAISAHTGDGMDALLDALKTYVAEEFAAHAHAPLITRERHRASLIIALQHLQSFLLCNAQELACEELRLAASEIGKITGIIAVDELLDHIFRDFCIGK